MIKLTRIDDRLIHGQVAFAWTTALGIDTILIANDKVAKDEFMKMTLGLAKPRDIKLLIKPMGEAVEYLKAEANRKILVLIDSVKDAHALANQIEEIRSINFGGIRSREGSRLVTNAIALTPSDVELIKELLAKGLELEVRQLPSERKTLLGNLI